ncbi:hypothetical protein AJ80_07460 [Polytolypa hystricis UAMH7299]|uniref:Uncharacterized protein n=1 Tax=Polytolypa hystricis (strain UAMH7299) TaxID=1447883 RepID=A0A2B7XNQ3_POLH7|nr:hypothetical protein AJ80_07460 [Polytolypa hystricis UAMH7299]
MNITSLRSSRSSYGDPRYASSISMGSVPPPSRVLLDGFKSALDSIQDETPRYNPLNPTHPRSSVLLNANDPVVMHLLTETAIGDSMQFEVLSFEEVEDLKKELSLLLNRIEASKRKLTLEMKLQEAALSLSRLYDPKARTNGYDHESSPDASPKSNRKRLSIFGRNSWGESHRSNNELAISTRKCEELAQELWKLERRATDIRRRLLEHTAGILQMTHKGLKKKSSSNIHAPRGPENLYPNGYQNGVAASSIDDFDDRSLYHTADNIDEFGGFNRRKPNGEVGAPPSALDLTAIQDTEKRLEDLNYRLREMILQADPERDIEDVPRNLSNDAPANAVASVQAHLEYLENGLDSMASNRGQSNVYDAEERLQDVNSRLEVALRNAGSSRSPTVSYPSHLDKSLPGQLDHLDSSVQDLERRIESLIEQKTILTTQIQQQRDLNSKSDAQRDAHIADLTEEIMHLKKDLDVTRGEEENAKNQLNLMMDQFDSTKQDSVLRDQSRAAEESELVNTERVSRQQAEESLQAKETAIARLEADILQLRSDNDSKLKEFVEARDDAIEEVNRLEAEYANLENETNRLRTEYANLENELSQLRSGDDSRIKEFVEERDTASEEANRLQAEYANLENELLRLRSENDSKIKEALDSRDAASEEANRLQAEYANLENELLQLRSGDDSKIKEIVEARDAASEEANRLQAEYANLENELLQLRSENDSKIKEAFDSRDAANNELERLQSEYNEAEGNMIRLQTELTMAKAELDGAYGSRAQRAAEAAANPAIQKEIDDLNQRNIQLNEEIAVLRADQLNNSNAGNTQLQDRARMLEKELRETIDDYEVMTKASIEFEKERDKLEGLIDGLRERCENLETQLSDERIQALGASGVGGREGMPSETTSTMVLKNEFKKMMRDTRTENLKALRAEQEERRRLEALLRSIKKEQSAGKSNLSQSTVAS